MLYSIVIPCYNSAKTIRKVVELTSAELNRLKKDSYEFILVDDFSPDGGKTLDELISLSKEYPFIKVVELAQNSGQHNAVMAGLNEASGDAIIAMDDDLQTHPSQLHILLEEFDKGFDIVYGYYPEKKHSLFRNFGSYVNYLSVRILIGKPKDMKTTILRLAGYISGEARIVAAALFCSVTYTITSLLASYLLRPIINKFIYFEEGGADLAFRIKGLLSWLVLLAIIYGISVFTHWLQQRLMLQASQRTLVRLRADLFAKLQSLLHHVCDEFAVQCAHYRGSSF